MMKREIFEEIGLDLTAIDCDIKHFGYDKKIFDADEIITHMFLVTFDSYDFIPYSKETSKGNTVVAMDPIDILAKIKEEKEKGARYFTPTIQNVFEIVRRHCKPIRQEIVLFGGPNSGLSEGVKRCIKFLSGLGIGVSSTLTLPDSYCECETLGNGHLSIRDIFPGYFDRSVKKKETRQLRIQYAYECMRRLLREEMEPDVGHKPVVILERSVRCVNIFNRAFEIDDFPVNHLLVPFDPDRLDIHVSPFNNDSAFDMALKRWTYTLVQQEVYQKTYEIYEKNVRVEYPDHVTVKNNFGKNSEDFFTDGLVITMKKHESIGQLIEHAQ